MSHYFLLIFLLCFQSFSQNKFSDTGNREGNWRGYYETGEIRYEGVFKDGKETGVFKYYYKSGNLEKELLYIEDGIRAKVRIYYSNRKIKTLGEYCFKKRCGTWEYFNDSGQIIIKENYKKGLLNGLCFNYYNGVLTDLFTYKNGKKNGISKSFFFSGQVKSIKKYFNDKLHGQFELFNKRGELIESLNYKNGFLE